MTRGPKPKPTAIRRAEGNRGKRAWNHDEPLPPASVPDCPPHLNERAREEWYRLVDTLVELGVVTVVDRAALAAYCQAWARWVEAEEKLAETPVLLKTPSGYVQQSPWLSIANKQLELMGRYMAELGLTPASRSRVAAVHAMNDPGAREVRFVTIYEGRDGVMLKAPLDGSTPGGPFDPADDTAEVVATYTLDPRL